jgi:gluconolactonase
MTTLPAFTPLQGGIPIIVNGQIIGAVVTAGPIAVRPHEVNVEVVRFDPAIDAIVPLNPKIFKLAEGFQFTEGPIWMKNGDFLFSDPNANKIYKYAANGTLSVFKKNSGYLGKDIAEYFQPGSNGLTLDPEGRLTINEHGNRRVTRVGERRPTHRSRR